MRRPILVALGGASALLIVGMLISLVMARQPAATYAVDSPPGAVAAYLRLLEEGQVDRAYAMVSASAMTNGPYGSAMTLSDYHRQFDNWSQRSHRATLVRSQVTATTASVVVDIATFSGGAFGGSDNTQRVTFTLVQAKGRWLISGPQYLGY